MKVDGRQIADGMYASLRARREGIARAPRLGIFVSGADPVIESFVRIKRRAADVLDIELERVDFDAQMGTDAACAAVSRLAGETDGIIVQLPLPKGLDTDRILAAIPREKDVDGVNPSVSERLVQAPVALAVVEILRSESIEISGKRVVVVGEGRLVGRPAATLLRALGAEVRVVTLEKGGTSDLQEADIIVSGAGSSGLIKPAHIKEGVALIDAGTSESAGKVVGDADPTCAEKAALFTPVPGGVGPVAVAMIFRNLLDLVMAAR
jgi:methylenetetrahydrofolate dehydrogenase (NADP+) / methenyltetrahydrofolate cyclohydrolase